MAGNWSPNRLALFPAGTVTAPAGAAAGPLRTSALPHTAAGAAASGAGAEVADAVGAGLPDPGPVRAGCGGCVKFSARDTVASISRGAAGKADGD